MSSVSVSCTAGCHAVNIERHLLFIPLTQTWRLNFVRLNPFAARFHRSIAQQSRGHCPVLPFILRLDNRSEANTDVDTASGVL